MCAAGSPHVYRMKRRRSVRAPASENTMTATEEQFTSALRNPGERKLIGLNIDDVAADLLLDDEKQAKDYYATWSARQTKNGRLAVLSKTLIGTAAVIAVATTAFVVMTAGGASTPKADEPEFIAVPYSTSEETFAAELRELGGLKDESGQGVEGIEKSNLALLDQAGLVCTYDMTDVTVRKTVSETLVDDFAFTATSTEEVMDRMTAYCYGE
jgi:multisubunit Na+/H+ antiporter MnhC subunit